MPHIAVIEPCWILNKPKGPFKSQLLVYLRCSAGNSAGHLERSTNTNGDRNTEVMLVSFYPLFLLWSAKRNQKDIRGSSPNTAQDFILLFLRIELLKGWTIGSTDVATRVRLFKSFFRTIRSAFDTSEQEDSNAMRL